MLNYFDAVTIAAVVVIPLGQFVVIPLIGQIAMAINIVFVAILLRELRSKNDATKIILRELRSREHNAINRINILRELPSETDAINILRSENTYWMIKRWRLKLKERDEEIQKLTMDNETLAKEVATLKSGISNVQMLWKKYM
jgi:cell division protein FtsB